MIHYDGAAMTIHLGIVGAGRVAREHVRAARAAGSRVVAVCDCDLEKAQTFAAEYQCDRSFDSISELLAIPELEALVVAVPNAHHKDVAVQCLNAGKDILLEKPMAMSVAECDAIIDCARSMQRLVQMGFVCRAAPKALAVQQLIAEGVLGEIYHAKAFLHRQRGIPGLGRWFTTKKLSGGGVLIDIGVHLIDLVMHLTGAKRAITVSAFCESRFGSPIDQYIYEEMWAGPPDPNGTFDVEDSATGLIRFDQGVTFEVSLAWASNTPHHVMPEGILLLGDRGGCFFDLWGDRFLLSSENDNAVRDEQIKIDNTDAWNRAWTGQHQRFADAVLQRGEPLAGGLAGREVQAIVQAMYTSSSLQREVIVSR